MPRHGKIRVWGVEKKQAKMTQDPGKGWVKSHFMVLWKSIPKTEFCIFYLSNSNYWGMSKKSLKVYMYLMKFYRVNV